MEYKGFIMLCFCCAMWISCCSFAQLCLTLCDPMDCSTPGFPVPHHLPEFAQVHVHWIGDAIQSSHPLSPFSPPALNLSQLQGLFQSFPGGSDGKESDICIHISLPVRASLPPTSPPLGHYRAPRWTPSARQQLPTRYLFYTWLCRSGSNS